mgnify:CR=1 FL=1
MSWADAQTSDDLTRDGELNIPSDFLSHNYCRSLESSDKGAWCYREDALRIPASAHDTQQWEYCRCQPEQAGTCTNNANGYLPVELYKYLKFYKRRITCTRRCDGSCLFCRKFVKSNRPIWYIFSKSKTSKEHFSINICIFRNFYPR